MTYESAEEARILRSIWGQGDLQNTVFAILDPYGRSIVNGQRSPMRVFRDASDMATYMDKVAAHYRGYGSPTWLPGVDTVRLGLNVAACDNRPLVIVVAATKSERDTLQARMAPTAWSDRL
ncbi:MAG TPA: thioredoxin family protein, partial [Candidatus Melainabacteria bacterium]|nr:thioredoxin family protein [Candidatus Melainabacteria bacterium]